MQQKYRDVATKVLRAILSEAEGVALNYRGHESGEGTTAASFDVTIDGTPVTITIGVQPL